jgi:hypothetical protein
MMRGIVIVVAALGLLATVVLSACGDTESEEGASCLEPSNGCPDGYWLFTDNLCAPGPNGVVCSDRGDDLCHKLCQNDGDCGDAGCDVCRTESLCNGSDNCIGTSPMVCTSP